MIRSAVFFIITAIVTIALNTGCPIGQCRYGKIPVSEGPVTITAIEKTYEGSREFMKVSVKGLFVRDFYLTPEEYGKCIAAGGFSVGSKLTGTVVPGGPCPPMYYLKECR